MAYPRISAKFETTLALKVNIGDTTGTLTSVTDADGTALPNGTYSFTVDEGGSDFEYFEATITGTALSNVKSYTATALTETAGFLKQHRAGAEIKITDFTLLGRISQVLRGAEQLDAAAPLEYDGTATISGANMLATKAYVDSVVNGGTVTYDSQILVGVAGETISSGEWVYLKESDGRWWKTDANTASTCVGVKIGMAKGAGTAGASISGGVFTSGIEKTGSYSAGQLYYISNTAGALSTTAGENEVLVGVGDDNGDLIFLNLYDPESVTPDEKAALAGTSGTPSSTNKFVTGDNTSSASTDQTQTTQNSSVAVGETDATTNKVKIAQSFKPTKSKIRGVTLWKAATTGTAFTGTVTVSIQADSGSGEPDGSALTTVTMTNAEFLAATEAAEKDFEFTSEYTSLDTSVSADNYWIVIETSTTDSTNHPNFGINSAGGYSSGGAYYNNTTDGWTAISGNDLYFKTLEGNSDQVVVTNSSGNIPNKFYSLSELPKAAYVQDVWMNATPVIGTTPEIAMGSNTDGSVFYFYDSTLLHRFEKDAITGFFYETHAINPTIATPGNDNGSIIQIGSYIYFFTNDGTNVICSRFLAADLTGETSMTVPTVPCTTYVVAWTDGVNAWLVSAQSETTSRKWSLSGTTFTAASTATVTINIFDDNYVSTFFDGKFAYYASSGNPTLSIYKLDNINGSSLTLTSQKYYPISADAVNGLIVNIDDDRMYIGQIYERYNETAAAEVFINLAPITKP